MYKAFIPKERRPGETRVAVVPDSIKRLVKAGLEIQIEAGAGERAFLSDQALEAAGARIVPDARAALAEADLVLKVRHLEPDEADALKEGAVAVGLMNPYANLGLVGRLAQRRITAIPMELIPRITRAQKMDALSSQANIAGYKAVLVAASHLPRYFPLLMTAAGTVKPARVIIMGAGVAGLQAIATARRLGAVVEVSDIRAEVKEQVESLGGKFIDLPELQSGTEAGGYAREVTPDFLRKQQAIVAEHVKQAGVVITTALVPGRKAPVLVTEEMVRSMRPGSVIVDLAVEQGGNCALSQPDQEVDVDGVRIIGPSNLPATVPMDASMLYARNVQELVLELFDKEGKLVIDLENDVLTGAVLTHAGEVRNAGIADALKKGDAA